VSAALEVEDVTVRFGGHLALDRVDLQAEAGKVTGLIGPNGAGKTTLFNVVTGLVTPQSGRVLVDGRDVTRLAPYRRARRGLARTFQRLELFGLLTVRENVELAASVRGARRPGRDADAALEVAGLADLAGSRADELPTGTARRVELARALATGPRVLLLDEIAGGLTEAELLELVDTIKVIHAGGVSIVWIEHIVHALLRVVDRMVAIDYGRKVAEGDPHAVMSSDEVRSVYLGAEA
jgi:branched-chain amino acid transport system ATP-binding protein